MTFYWMEYLFAQEGWMSQQKILKLLVETCMDFDIKIEKRRKEAVF